MKEKKVKNQASSLEDIVKAQETITDPKEKQRIYDEMVIEKLEAPVKETSDEILFKAKNGGLSQEEINELIDAVSSESAIDQTIFINHKDNEYLKQLIAEKNQVFQAIGEAQIQLMDLTAEGKGREIALRQYFMHLKNIYKIEANEFAIDVETGMVKIEKNF